MSLNKGQLKTDLKNLLDASKAGNGDAQTNETAFINSLADAIEKYVKSATIIYNNGLLAGSSPVVGTFNGSLA